MPYKDKEQKRLNGMAYRRRPEVIAKRRLRSARPDVKAKARSQQMRWRYGITRDEFNDLFESQGRRCAICGTTESGVRDWHIDHSHVTGTVRGILCRHCNPMLGKAKDDPDILRRAADYLDRAILKDYSAPD